MFETFSGIGAQHKALSNLKKKELLDYKVVGTSDWDVFSVQSYAAIHFNKKINIKKITLEELINFIENYNLSKDGKKPLKIEKNVWIAFLKQNFIQLKHEFIEVERESNLNQKYPLLFKKTNNFNFIELVYWYHSFKITNNIGSIVNSYERYKKFVYQQHPNLLTYSFPCQDLSTAGNFHGFNQGIKAGTRSGLLLEIEKLLKTLKENKEELPKFLVLENVKNLISKQHKASFDDWLKTLKQLGYSTYWGVLNSHEFGMIQARNRVFAVSILDNKGVINSHLDELVKKTLKAKNYKIKQQKTTSIYDLKNTDLEESLWAQIKDTPSRKRMIDAGLLIDESITKTPTISTKQDRLPNAGILEFKYPRKDINDIPYASYRFIQPKESYRLMGFDAKDYEKAKAMMKKAVKNAKRIETAPRDILWKQAGNSLPVNVMEAIFFWIINYKEEVK